MLLWAAALLLLIGCGRAQYDDEQPDEQLPEEMLMNRALTNYTMEIEPPSVTADGTPTPFRMNVKFRLEKVLSLNSASEHAEMMGRVTIRWSDPRLRWDDSGLTEYAHIHTLLIPTNRVWTPRLALSNSVTNPYERTSSADTAIVSSNGTVTVTPTGTYKVFCQLDLQMFPFDIQTCAMHFDNLLTRADRTVFETAATPEQPNIDISCPHDPDTGSWHVLGVRQHVYIKFPNITVTIMNNVSDIYKFGDPSKEAVKLKFEVVMQRRYSFYIMSVIYPSALISILQASFFLLKIDDSRKLTLCMQAVVVFAIFQLGMTPLMPENSNAIPVILIYLDLLLGLMVFLIVENVILTVLLSQTEVREVPSGLWSIVSGPCGLAWFRGPSTDLNEVKNPEVAMLKRANMVTIPDENGISILNRIERDELTAEVTRQRRIAWLEVARVFDFYMLFLVLTLCVAMPILCFIYFPSTINNSTEGLRQCSHLDAP